MLKKINLKSLFPFLLIAIFVGWFSYKFFIERKPRVQPTMTLDWDQLDGTTGSKVLETPASIQVDEEVHAGDSANAVESIDNLEVDDKDFKEFDSMEKMWISSVEGIFSKDLFKHYLKMREQNEKEKMLAYKEYHEYLRKKYGENFSYNISEDQSVREKEINQRYLKELLKLVGEEKFQIYLKTRDELNEQYRRNNKEFIQVEF